MERPVCGTCVYWDWEEHVEEDGRDEEGNVIPVPDDKKGDYARCHRRSPGAVPEIIGSPLMNASISDIVEDETVWPLTNCYDWCGEHPGFPAYIASLKTQNTTST